MVGGAAVRGAASSLDVCSRCRPPTPPGRGIRARRAGEEDGLGELYAIHVHPDAQGHGNGRRLLEAAVRKLESQRYRKARLWVLAANSTAQRFYQRNRWSRVDGLVRTENIEGVAVDEVAYERSLQPRT
jgi:ribosomal protein S18 acetylase RimI-like enzyme